MMKKPARHSGGDRHILYGVNPVIEALRADRRPDQITIAQGSRDERLRELIELARLHSVPVTYAVRGHLDREAGNSHHQGVIARIAASQYADADDLLESISARVGTEPEPLVLVLDGIEDPRNLGAILRTAECAGASGVFIPERRAAGLNETVAKASAGAVEYLPVARVTNLSVLIRQLKERNVWVWPLGLDAADGHSAGRGRNRSSPAGARKLRCPGEHSGSWPGRIAKRFSGGWNNPLRSFATTWNRPRTRAAGSSLEPVKPGAHRDVLS
jgi:23S rRNA (guanosine2251-2'-O)-methyltransferase